MTHVEPIGPVEIRPRPVEGPLAIKRAPRPAKRDPQRDPKGRKASPQAKNELRDGHIDVRA